MLNNGTEIDLANLEKPLLLINEDEELLFQQLILPTLRNELIECQLALSTRKSISLVRDFWLALYKDREQLYINSGHAMLYPIRLILFELVTQTEHFKRLAKKSLGDECLSLIYAVVLLQFILRWLKDRFQNNSEVYKAMKLLYRVTEDYLDDAQVPISREHLIAQAIAVKAIRYEVKENAQEFASLLYQTYNFLNYLHDKVKEQEGNETNSLPSMRNVADILNLFYSERYTTDNPSFTG